MTEAQARKTFEKHNPAGDIKRCPNGKAKLRDLLHVYAQAAANLYGIISLGEFVEIFNAQNKEQTTADEVYALLLPGVVKAGWNSTWYGFYGDSIVHYNSIRNFDLADDLEQEQTGKPRFVPPKEQFLEFEWEDYTDNEHWDKIYAFLKGAFIRTKNVSDAIAELRAYFTRSLSISMTGVILDRYDLVFADKKQAHGFFDMLALAKSDTRVWHNKGHTPNEMAKMFPPQKRPKEPTLQLTPKIEPNKPCPCGSGKKYKKCCQHIGNSEAALLSLGESYFFYRTWYKLLDFVNKKLRVVDCKISPKPEDAHDAMVCYKIRNKLWENPKVIGEFLRGTSDLSYDETCLLRSWEERHVKGKFVLMKYLPECAIFMPVDNGKDRRLYSVKGITTSVAENTQHKLPVMLDTVLLPFTGKIIYDSFIISHEVEFGEGMRRSLDEEYAELSAKYGIAEKL